MLPLWPGTLPEANFARRLARGQYTESAQAAQLCQRVRAVVGSSHECCLIFSSRPDQRIEATQFVYDT